jgi:hypothetical protein
MSELVTLDDSMILSMARNPNFLLEFPILKSAVTSLDTPGVATMKKRRCGDCNKPVAAVVSNMNQIKYSLVNMSKEKKKKLLQMLNTKQIRVHLSVDSRVARYTISD